MYCWCNVLLYNTFYGRPYNFHNGLIKLSCILRCFRRVRAQELCESRGGRPWAPVPNKPTVSVDVKQHFNFNTVVSCNNYML